MTMPQEETPGGTSPRLPDRLPVLPLRGGLVVYPLAVLPLVVGQERSVKLVDDVMRGERMVALVAQRDPELEYAGPDDLYSVGTAATIHQLVRAADGSLRVVVQGIERIRLLDYVSTEPYLIARVVPAPEAATTTGVMVDALRRAVADLFRRLVELSPEIPNELAFAAQTLPDARQLAYLVASTASLPAEAREEILELDAIDAKLNRLVELIQREIAVRELGQRITSDTQQRLTKAQREMYLREQLRSIQKELGDGEEGSEVEQLRRRFAEMRLPDTARREVDRELDRLASIPEASPEHGMIRTYLDWMVALPWDKTTGSEIDVPFARRVLDEDHYDLEKIKDRILEYLAVRKLREMRAARQTAAGTEAGEAEPPTVPSPRSETPTDRAVREPILCFVGPPGVGKTSLGQSIARALGRKFIRMSLGGIRDEAEIRGHRRTYIGAMPGRIVQGIRQAEARDPVFMLDEIDKVGADWRGDPSSALLEVLDPAQNHSFTDNYLGVPFDLSQVLFVATANTLDTVPAPLRDRMEVLALAGYTEEEKVAIARQYLVPKQLQAHGLSNEELSFDDASLREVVRSYTREAGVRSLDRQIATLCRKVAREIAEGRSQGVQLTPDLVRSYLGRPPFDEEVAERTEAPGVATGLAWTPVGGDVLFVEATTMPSRDERLILTGMLGDVMRESATAAVSYVRSNAERLGIDADAFEGRAIHIHVPAGAVPKDGPSAGVTMATALVSLAIGKPVRPDVAMTGEITLRGRVLPVGGIKEKVLAAHRMGLRTVILPARNERDLEEVPADLRGDMTFVFANRVDEVLAAALGLDIPGTAQPPAPQAIQLPAAASDKGEAR